MNISPSVIRSYGRIGIIQGKKYFHEFITIVFKTENRNIKETYNAPCEKEWSHYSQHAKDENFSHIR